MARWLEEDSSKQCGADNGKLVSCGETAQERLQGKDTANIDQSKGDCQCAIDQRAIDNDINLPQPGTQDRKPDGKRNEKEKEVNDGTSDHRCERTGLDIYWNESSSYNERGCKS